MRLLFGRRFNPLDYLQVPEPAEIRSRSRQAQLAALEARFRFLAADGKTVLKGRAQQVTYRQALLRACHSLRLTEVAALSTPDLEAEIFLRLSGRVWKRLPANRQQALLAQVQRSLAERDASQPLPARVQRDPARLLLKGGSATAVSTVLGPLLLRQLAHQFAWQLARYQAAQQALAQAGTAAIGHQVALHAARQGMTATAARYSTARAALAFVGPALWGWFLADLGWRTIATNHGRIIPAIFVLAQIRLTRSEP